MTIIKNKFLDLIKNFGTIAPKTPTAIIKKLLMIAFITLCDGSSVIGDFSWS
jgi:hypothetical protein